MPGKKKGNKKISTVKDLCNAINKKRHQSIKALTTLKVKKVPHCGRLVLYNSG